MSGAARYGDGEARGCTVRAGQERRETKAREKWNANPASVAAESVHGQNLDYSKRKRQDRECGNRSAKSSCDKRYLSASRQDLVDVLICGSHLQLVKSAELAWAPDFPSKFCQAYVCIIPIVCRVFLPNCIVHFPSSVMNCQTISLPER